MPRPVAARTARATRAGAGRSSSPIALGSLTQVGARVGGGCRACGSPRVTSIQMSLTDGSPVQFTSCHRCEHRTWSEDGQILTSEHVLAKTRKER